MHGLFFDRIDVIPYFRVGVPQGYDLYWSLRSPDFTPKYSVEWARKPEGPWGDILNPAAAPSEDNFIIGALPMQRQNFADAVWFRIKVYKESKLVLTSQPVDNRNRMPRREYLRYRDMLRQVNLALTKFSASQPGYLLRRKIYGAKCPECLDEILDTPTNSECPTCMGTGIDGGYYDPVRLMAAWGREGAAKNVNTTKEPSGPTQVEKRTIALFPFPEAKSEDVWVDAGTRHCYLVERNNPIMFCGSPIESHLVLSLLPAHHPIYNLEIDVDGNRPGSVEDPVIASDDISSQ